MPDFIAERKLLCAIKDTDARKEIIIRLSAPYFVREGTVDFPVGKEGLYACQIEIEGLNDSYPEVFGADSLQAITLATNAIETFLQRLLKKYDFYYLSGEPYFDA